MQTCRQMDEFVEEFSGMAVTSLIVPGVRWLIFEHLQNLDHMLYLIELAGTTVSAEKL